MGSLRRLCGEEFALIASNASLEQITAALGDLLRAIETTPFVTLGGAIRITMSAGIAIRNPFEPFERLYAEADEVLYRAKRSGRNRIELSPRVQEAPTPKRFHEPAASDEDRKERQTKN
jgi:diguanylate cyclase (GGDEF)-like protein